MDESLGLVLQVVRQDAIGGKVVLEESGHLVLVPAVLAGPFHTVTVGAQLWRRPLNLGEMWVLTKFSCVKKKKMISFINDIFG